MARPPLDGIVLITGASSGIGEALARRLGPIARELVLVARRAERLEALATELTTARPTLRVRVCPCDLADAAQVQALLADLGPIDVLVNNAGLGDLTLLERTSWDKLDWMLQVNVTALTRLTHALVPGMVARGRGGVLNVSSVYGLIWQPGVAAYVGSKHYVTAFTESLRSELRGTGVVVTLVCPGPVQTGFEDVAGTWFARKPPRFVFQHPDRTARAALRGFVADRARVTPGLVATATAWIASLTPHGLLRLVYAPFAWSIRRAGRTG